MGLRGSRVAPCQGLRQSPERRWDARGLLPLPLATLSRNRCSHHPRTWMFPFSIGTQKGGGRRTDKDAKVGAGPGRTLNQKIDEPSEDSKIYLNVDLIHAGLGPSVVWGCVPLAVGDYDVLEIVNGHATPVFCRAIWIESAAACPAELVEEGLAPGPRTLPFATTRAGTWN